MYKQRWCRVSISAAIVSLLFVCAFLLGSRLSMMSDVDIVNLQQVFIRLMDEAVEPHHNLTQTSFESGTHLTFDYVPGGRFHIYNHSGILTCGDAGELVILVIGYWSPDVARTEYTLYSEVNVAEPDLICLFRYQDGSTAFVSARFEYATQDAGIRFLHVPFLLWCPLHNQSVPTHVAVQSKERHHDVQRSQSRQIIFIPVVNQHIASTGGCMTMRQAHHGGRIALCLKAIHYYRSARTITEWMELHRMLGVHKVILYGYQNVSEPVHRLFQHYQRQGLLEVQPWKHKWHSGRLKELGSGIHNNGQELAFNDCLHRHWHEYDYMVFTDIDEVIMPSLSLQRKGVFTFQEMLEYLFVTRLKTVDVQDLCFLKFHWATVCVKNSLAHHNDSDVRLFTQLYTKRDKRHKCRKVIVRPSEVVRMSVHYAERCRQGHNFTVSDQDAVVQHYRFQPTPGMGRKCRIPDHSTAKYAPRLRQNVDHVLKKLMTKGTVLSNSPMHNG